MRWRNEGRDACKRRSCAMATLSPDRGVAHAAVLQRMCMRAASPAASKHACRARRVVE